MSYEMLPGEAEALADMALEKLCCSAPGCPGHLGGKCNYEERFGPRDVRTLWDGLKITGGTVNESANLLAYIASAIRRGYPQVRLQPTQQGRVALVCGGPSLEPTLPELRDLIAEGAKVVTVNGAYSWCIERNIIPSMQVVMDARSFNSRFVNPPLPRCHYAVASQAHPSTWDAVEGRPNVWIWHCGANPGDAAFDLLDRFYRKNWHPVAGGVTVGTRAIGLLRMLGYLRFDVFGMDSCVMGEEDRHHGYQQPENDTDRVFSLKVHPTGRPDLSRKFRTTVWHVQQADDVVQFIRHNGDKFLLNFHGDGLIAHLLNSAADMEMAADS